jgi:SagB-type dehydrogenase family enzyme
MGNDTDTRIHRVRAVHTVLSDAAPAGTRSVVLSDATGSLTLRAPQSAPTLPLGQALQKRRSRYDFGALGHLELSSLLRWALGPQRTVQTAGGQPHPLNMHPSAGGLPSMTTYVVVLQHIKRIPEGVYVFDRAGHRLLLRRTGDVRGALASCLVQPEFAERAPVVVVLTGELNVTLTRYSERHYRTLHVDAGIAAANLYLVATALDLACCAISGFYDEFLGQVLSLGNSQIPLLAFAVGARREIGEQG